jgi:hypothetical protein
MPVSHEMKNQFETELDEGDHPRHCLSADTRSAVLQSHPRLAEGEQVDWAELEEFRSEHGLGCARGVLWALIFEAALVIAAAAIYWKFHLSR